MQIGVTVPITEIGADFGGLQDYIQAAEDLGYSHIRILDHVLGADPKFHPEVPEFPYTHQTYIHEPFTLMAYLAAITKKVQLVTGILILPQRQTVLVAKQSAEIDVLSGGRLRLGIGIGWNPVEYEALGENFHNRGRRSEEQIALLRMLWTQDVVDFTGRSHRVAHAGLNPLPVQRPIPVWFGAGRGSNPIPPEPVLRRIGRLADGWFPSFPPGEAGQGAIKRVQDYALEAGRDPASIGIEGRINIRPDTGPEDWVTEVKAWEEMGASHLAVGVRGNQAISPDQHIDGIRRFHDALNF